jgi:hypothetical protein
LRESVSIVLIELTQKEELTGIHKDGGTNKLHEEAWHPLKAAIAARIPGWLATGCKE